MANRRTSHVIDVESHKPSTSTEAFGAPPQPKQLFPQCRCGFRVRTEEITGPSQLKLRRTVSFLSLEPFRHHPGVKKMTFEGATLDRNAGTPTSKPETRKIRGVKACFCLVVPFHGPPMIRILKHAACLSWGLPLTVRSFLPGSTNGIEGYPRAAWMPELRFAIQTRSLSVQLPTFLSMKENRNA
ncbi:hypothetical protein NMY22_g6410 [Coprinellus aureogranulatus]|nr:hypothetical protein NMY22_g6410 [Coprinellus aureogranulatus]